MHSPFRDTQIPHCSAGNTLNSNIMFLKPRIHFKHKAFSPTLEAALYTNDTFSHIIGQSKPVCRTERYEDLLSKIIQYLRPHSISNKSNKKKTFPRPICSYHLTELPFTYLSINNSLFRVTDICWSSTRQLQNYISYFLNFFATARKKKTKTPPRVRISRRLQQHLFLSSPKPHFFFFFRQSGLQMENTGSYKFVKAS